MLKNPVTDARPTFGLPAGTMPPWCQSPPRPAERRPRETQTQYHAGLLASARTGLRQPVGPRQGRQRSQFGRRAQLKPEGFVQGGGKPPLILSTATAPPDRPGVDQPVRCRSSVRPSCTDIRRTTRRGRRRHCARLLQRGAPDPAHGCPSPWSSRLCRWL
jgi:hypothetical protein